MIRYLLDTDTTSYFLKNRDPRLVARVRAVLRVNQVAISAFPMGRSDLPR